jgi:hypothetical protein
MSMSGSRRRWRAAIVAMLALVVVAEGAAPATAGKKVKTRIEIKRLKTSGAAGTLSSSSDKCLSHRKVSLFTWDGYRSQKIAITNSDQKGDWRVNRNLEGGTRYFAKVDAKGKCGYDTSPFKRL